VWFATRTTLAFVIHKAILFPEKEHSLSENKSDTMYPSLKDPEHANVRLKNVGREVYLCVTQDKTGNPVLGTKTLSEHVDPDGEYGINSRIPFR